MPCLSDEHWMRRALVLADQAQAAGEVPVGAVLVLNDEVVGEGWNAPIAARDPTAHAEIRALRAGAIRLANYRLPETVLYVTLEPCTMCAGAIMQARVARVVYGAVDPKGGAAGSVFDFLNVNRSNHWVDCQGGLLAEESARRLRAFFQQRRSSSR